MTEIVLVMTTVATADEAERIARALVEEKVAACVSISAPTTSVYRWNGVVERAVEHQLVVKTTADRASDVGARIRELHSYELPELLVLPVAGGGQTYLDWVAGETRR